LQVEQGSALEPKVAALSAFGQKVQASDLGSKVNGLQLVGDEWVGAADPRAEGTTASIDAAGRITTKASQAEKTAPTASVH
jgi:gamma-glutamyltranspeptidase / glutathione hydrolase